MFGISDRALCRVERTAELLPGECLVAGKRPGGLFHPMHNCHCERMELRPPPLRRHLAALVSAGLIDPKRQPKRQAIRPTGSKRRESTRPSVSAWRLLSHAADEIFAQAARIAAERERLRITKERLSICRRDIAKLLDIAPAQHATGDWLLNSINFRVDRGSHTTRTALRRSERSSRGTGNAARRSAYPVGKTTRNTKTKRQRS